MKTNTNASKTGVATPNSLEGSEVSEANDTFGGVPTQAKPHKRRMAREQASARTVERKADAGNAAPSPTPRATSKIACVIALLERAGGATLPEMIEATGWLPHTTRAALTGLKKRGHTISKDKRGDVTCYHIAKGG